MKSPLAPKRIVVTRSREQAPKLCAKLAALGVTPLSFPVIQFAPLPAPELDQALAELNSFTWLLFTSANAVRFFWQRLPGQISAGRLPEIGAVGSATQALLQQKGVTVDFLPDTFTGEQLVAGLGDISGKRVLLPRAKIGRPEIINLLQDRRAEVVDIALYDTVTAAPTQTALDELQEGFDLLTFTSPSSVRNFMKLTDGRYRQAASAVIGPSTAAEAENFGLQVNIMPTTYTIDALVAAIAQGIENEVL